MHHTDPSLPLPQPDHTGSSFRHRSEEHTSELQSQSNLVCRLLLEKKKKTTNLHPQFTPLLHFSTSDQVLEPDHLQFGPSDHMRDINNRLALDHHAFT